MAGIVDKERYPELFTGCTTFLPHGARCAAGMRATWYKGNNIAFHWGAKFGSEEDQEELKAWLYWLGDVPIERLKRGRSHINRYPDVLYRDDLGVIYAFGNESESYVYLAAVLRKHLPEDFDWERTKYAYWGGGA